MDGNAPPLGHGSDGLAPHIEPTDFRPGATGRPKRKLTPTRIALLAVAAVVVWFLWFIFTAKSVRLEIHPTPDTVEVTGGFAVQVGEIQLLRAGAYELHAARQGYEPLALSINVGSPRIQTFSGTMARLPGHVTFDIDPVGATVVIPDVQAEGAAPFKATLPAGPRVAHLSHPRYQLRTVEFDVEGLDKDQTVTAAMSPNWADVRIPTVPSGAAISIDDEPSSYRTPGPVPVLAGERRVTVKLAGYKSWSDILLIEPGKALDLPAVDLTIAGAVVDVTSRPSGATITLDGVYQGLTPLEVEVIPDRRHELRAFKVGFAPVTRTLGGNAGQKRTMDFTLEELQGDVAIETLPPEAELWLNGTLVGNANGSFTWPAVAHDLEIRLAGHASFTREMTPQPGFTQSLRVKLLTLEEARMEALRQVRSTSQGQELVLLMPGTVQMGASRREPGRRANEVLRSATLTRLFYLGRHEVTNGQFRAFAKGHNSGEYQNITLDHPLQPATGLSWLDAALYCNWLSEQDGLDPFYRVEFGKVVGFDQRALGYRLPTEAEWAWAARTVDGQADSLRYAWGDRLPPPANHGNYADADARNIVARIILDYRDNNNVSATVGTFPPNARGIHDLGGNVAEWIHDFYEIPSGNDTVDPLGPPSGDYHVIRGASWQKGTVSDLRLSFRDYGTEGRNDVGFRIARFAE